MRNLDRAIVGKDLAEEDKAELPHQEKTKKIVEAQEAQARDEARAKSKVTTMMVATTTARMLQKTQNPFVIAIVPWNNLTRRVMIGFSAAAVASGGFILRVLVGKGKEMSLMKIQKFNCKMEKRFLLRLVSTMQLSFPPFLCILN